MKKIVSFPTSASALRPLRSTSENGTPYKRFPEVESQIGRMLEIPYINWPGTVRTVLDGKSVKNETIVYLIHESWVHGHDEVLLALHECLFDRMALIIKRRAARMSISECEPLAEWVQDRIIGRLYADEISRAGEFLEIAFGRAVVVEIFKWNRRNGEYWKRIDVDTEKLDHLLYADPTNDFCSSITEIERQLTLDQIVQNARKVLAPPHFEAFYLHYIKGIPVESDGSSAPSLETHFRRHRRTIYGWLERSLERIRTNLARRPGYEDEP